MLFSIILPVYQEFPAKWDFPTTRDGFFRPFKSGIHVSKALLSLFLYKEEMTVKFPIASSRLSARWYAVCKTRSEIKERERVSARRNEPP